MTNERKAELFKGAMNWVWEHMEYFDKEEVEMALEHIGFTEEEIAEELADSIFAEDEDDEEYTPSASNGDYSPSNPWDAPGHRISDFIGGVYD